MDSDEEWKLIDGYDYFISTHGNVENARTGKILKPGIDRLGYYIVNLHKNRKGKTFTVHRLVANAFIDNPENKNCVDHINNNKLDNRVENLRWATESENQHNKSMHLNNTSGYKGVYYKASNRWCAEITINYKKIFIGCFKTKEEAISARKEYANEFFGEYTHISEKE